MSTVKRLQKCLIANRGEIAARIIRTCRELDIVPVAVFSDADAQAQHVRMADEAYRLGGAAARESYLNIERIIEVALQSGCDCVHPGYGFLSETEAFAEAVMRSGLVWVGPPPDAIRVMGVKTEARGLMKEAGVPLVPGFQADSVSDDALAAAAEQLGYPVMIKAAGGGGGKGIRVVQQPAAFREAVAAARHEADAAFGDPRVYLERYIESGRHIEIQVLADQYGNVIHLYERECSAQRRHQKVIEETPSPLLDGETRMRMGAAAVAAARAVNYVNAGTIEFIVTPNGEFYFLEMNTRLQVEHPITELVTGVDLVKLQLRIAAGEPLPITQSDIRQQGHAVECRLYAEDPQGGFLPSTGRLLRFIPPEGPGIRIDSGVETGDSIGIHYDPMIAKLIVHDRTREDATQRMLKALASTVILGLNTNLEFLQALLRHPTFQNGQVDTNFIESHLDELLVPPDAPPLAALIAAALGGTGSSTTTLTDGGTVPVSVDPWQKSDGFRLGFVR